tara:strand:+ start:319 stop:579 length:261 start_codon:yes stop_codon:yes gene_type:complete
MKIFTITQTNNKEWTNHVTAYANLETALNHFLRVALNFGVAIIKDEIKEELEEMNYSFITKVDSFGRKWGIELRETIVQNDLSWNV